MHAIAWHCAVGAISHKLIKSSLQRIARVDYSVLGGVHVVDGAVAAYRMSTWCMVWLVNPCKQLILGYLGYLF